MNSQLKSDIETQLDQYAWCMKLIKLRIDFLGQLLAGKDANASTGHLLPDVEIGAVQLRKCLELIAMASIAANESDYRLIHDTFKKQWNASLIVRDIERINPDFYPKPFIQKDDSKGRKVDLEPEGDFLSKKEFTKLYEWCGARLHAINPYRPDRDEGKKYKNDLYKIEHARQKIVRLLNSHRAVLVNDRTEIWCLMASSGNDGKPQAFLMTKHPMGPNSSSKRTA